MEKEIIFDLLYEASQYNLKETFLNLQQSGFDIRSGGEKAIEKSRKISAIPYNIFHEMSKTRLPILPGEWEKTRDGSLGENMFYHLRGGCFSVRLRSGTNRMEIVLLYLRRVHLIATATPSTGGQAFNHRCVGESSSQRENLL